MPKSSPKLKAKSPMKKPSNKLAISRMTRDQLEAELRSEMAKHEVTKTKLHAALASMKETTLRERDTAQRNIR